MAKFLLLLSFICLGTLIILSIVAPNTPAVWLASTGIGYNITRVLLMSVLFVLLVTNPPRNKYFRYFVGLLAISVSAWSVLSTYQNDMKLLDTTSILAATVSMGIVALEYRSVEDEAVILKDEPISFSLLTQ